MPAGLSAGRSLDTFPARLHDARRTVTETVFGDEDLSGERITLRELAHRSGVSAGTVSRALNGYADVNAETRERIIALARELDYTPAAAARSLKTQRSHVVGVFLETGAGRPDLQHPFFHEVLVGVKAALGPQGFDLLLFASERPGNGYGDHSHLKRCRHHNVEGVVLMGLDADDEDVRRLLRSDLPKVAVDLTAGGDHGHSVGSDSVQGARLAVEHLHALGHRRIATITGLVDTVPGAERLRGYRDALRDLGLAYRDELVAYGDFYVDSGRQAAERLLALPAEDRPTAIFAAADLMAIGAMRAVTEAGLRVPEDVSVVGFDDIQLAEHLTPSLTTLRQDKARLGVEAGQALVRLMEGADDAAGVTTLPVELIERGSTAPVAR
jgi:LacI family transcriptional regulator